MSTRPHTLKTLREAAGMTQWELGEVIANPGTKFPQGRIASYETGRKRVPLPVAQRLVDILNARLKPTGIVAKLEHLVHESHR